MAAAKGPPPPLLLMDRKSEIQQQTSNLQKRFGDLLLQTQMLLNKKHSNSPEFLSTFRAAVAFLPASLSHPDIHFLHAKQTEISQATSVIELFVLMTNHWDYLSCTLLEHFVNTFGNEKLQAEMAGYLQELRLFRADTKLRDMTFEFAVTYIYSGIQPPDFSKMVTMMGPEWDECTLEDIEQFRVNMIHRASLSIYALRFIEVKWNTRSRGLSMTWCLPSLTAFLLAGVLDRTYLRQCHVQVVLIDGVALSNYRAHDWPWVNNPIRFPPEQSSHNPSTHGHAPATTLPPIASVGSSGSDASNPVTLPATIQYTRSPTTNVLTTTARTPIANNTTPKSSSKVPVTHPSTTSAKHAHSDYLEFIASLNTTATDSLVRIPNFVLLNGHHSPPVTAPPTNVITLAGTAFQTVQCHASEGVASVPGTCEPLGQKQTPLPHLTVASIARSNTPVVTGPPNLPMAASIARSNTPVVTGPPNLPMAASIASGNTPVVTGPPHLAVADSIASSNTPGPPHLAVADSIASSNTPLVTGPPPLVNTDSLLPTSKTNYISKVCGKSFGHSGTFRSHMRAHLEKNSRFLCLTCCKQFSSTTNLNAHMRTHTGDKPFSCPVCKRRFSQKASVNVHLRTHSGERPYKCQYCGKCFTDASTVAKHRRIHTGEKPFQCPFCDIRFSQSGNLLRHTKLVHGNGQYKRSPVTSPKQ